jgi:hypothetical protein
MLRRTASDQHRHGEKWSPAHLKQIAEQDGDLLRRSKDPAEHAHRAGLDRKQFEQLRGPERERAVEAIERARLRDQQRLEVISGEPGRVRGGARRSVEGLRQRQEESPTERRERLQRLRRERRRTPDPGLRRNLSRGGAR